MIKKLGVQLYTIREYMNDADEISSSFKKLKEIGYDEVQTAGIGSVTFLEMAEIAKACGIDIIGTHTGLQYLEENLETAINDHKLMGTTNCGLGAWTQYDTKEEVEDFIKEQTALPISFMNTV